MHGEEFFNQLPGREISELCYRFRKLRKLNLVSLRYTLILKISIIKINIHYMAKCNSLQSTTSYSRSKGETLSWQHSITCTSSRE